MRGRASVAALSASVPRRVGWAVLVLLLAGCGSARVNPSALPTADLPYAGAIVAYGVGETLVGLGVSTDGRLFVLSESGVQLVRGFDWGLGGELSALLTGETMGSGLLAPADFDPTNGQDVLIADGSRVLRFSDEGQRVQTLDVPAVDRLEPTPGSTRSPGEAVAVAAGTDGRVFVADASRGVVQVWRDGALVDVLDGLGRPVSLAADGRRVAVADAEQDVIRVLDSDGRPLATLEHEALAGLRSVSFAGDRILALGTEAVVVFEGGAVRVIPVSNGAALLDVALAGDRLFGVTADAVVLLGLVE
ncbi:MAG: hypothetical protein AAF791_14500 [Bacteroidota bacterium]